jgi:hypothetical protein
MDTCPKCASTQIERAPAFVSTVDKYAPTLAGDAVRAGVPEGATEHKPDRFVNSPSAHIQHTYAANPAPAIRCVNCGSAFDESEIDPSSKRFAFLKAEYAKAVA